MKILHVHSGNLYGGVETMLTTLARHNARCAGMEQHFALCFEGRFSRELRAADAAIYPVGPARLSRPYSVWRARRRLRQVLHHQHFDAVLCHSGWSQAIFGPVVRETSTPLVLYVHGAADSRHWLEVYAERATPSLIVCNSEFTASKLPATYRKVPHTVMYSAITPMSEEESDPTAVRASLHTAADATVIIQVGRMEPLKGHLPLLEALARSADLPGWMCWQVGGAQRRGEFAYVASLKKSAARLGISGRVHFLGERTDVRSLMAAADIYCQPNTSAESFGLTFVEALSAGLPVVTTAMGGACEIVTDDCGILVPPGDADALAAALRRVIVDRSLRQQLATAGLARVRQLGDVSSQLDALRRALSQATTKVSVTQYTARPATGGFTTDQISASRPSIR